MSEELSAMMFETLSRRVGENVNCTVWEGGSPVSYDGVLLEVVPFDFINVNKQIIPFVGTRQAIEEITLSSNGKKVYVNPRANGYQGFTSKDIMGVMNAQKEMLGYSIDLEKMKGPKAM